MSKSWVCLQVFYREIRAGFKSRLRTGDTYACLFCHMQEGILLCLQIFHSSPEHLFSESYAVLVSEA